jgi:hypothetical protein
LLHDPAVLQLTGRWPDILFKSIYMFLFNLSLTRQVSSEQILIYNDGLHETNPDDAGPIERCPMGLSITASCDTTWI